MVVVTGWFSEQTGRALEICFMFFMALPSSGFYLSVFHSTYMVCLVEVGKKDWLSTVAVISLDKKERVLLHTGLLVG